MYNQNNISIEIKTEIPPGTPNEAIALCVFSDEPQTSARLEEELSDHIKEALQDGEFKGEADTSLLFRTAGNKTGRRLLLLGLGARADFDLPALSRASGMAVRQARASRIKRLHFILPSSTDDEANLVRAVAEGAKMGLFDVGLYQARDGESPALEALSIITSEANEQFQKAVERGSIIAEAVNWTRLLANEPGASLPPKEFARRAAEMAQQFGLHVESLSADEIRARGMGGLWGVGQGSDQEPALIVVRYEPENRPASVDEREATDDELWAFVGKGITFDTGGISLKHGLDMYEMKSDMAGGAAVLGALRAIAQLKPQRRVIGIVPTAENMPSGRSIKPGDIVKTLAGFTIEVVDTDAEGRLVLVDGIAYARQLKATRIVDLATLTGSIIIALGEHRAGLFSNNDEWARQVQEAAARAGEPVWRMPVSDDYKARIESDIADFKNYGGRPDATAAALLLSKFAGETPWAHLDIAGTSWYDDPQPHAPKGANGTGVRTLIELVCG